MRGVVLFLKRLIRNYSQLVFLALSEVWLEGLNGVYRQPSKKPVIFYRQPSKSQCNINRQNVSGYFKSHYFDEILAPEESLHLKNQGPCCQKHTHSLFLSLWTLQDLTTSNICKLYLWKTKGTSKTQQLNINLLVNIYLSSWTKFSVDNRQRSKSLQRYHHAHLVRPSTILALITSMTGAWIKIFTKF